jgi:N-methylhydantoinase A
MGIRIGVDIGGSFTDFVAFDEDTGRLQALKVFSRPDLPGQDVMEGIRLLSERHDIHPEDITYFTHGTTVGVNTVIQRKGPRLALFTTRHFEDVLEMARLKIADMYNLLSRRPPVLIPREHVFGILERIGADSVVETELDETTAEDAVRRAVTAGCEGAVIAFLHAYRNPDHEQRMRRIVERIAPGLPIFCSSDVWPIIREYERTITAAISAYVQPQIARYLGSLQAALHAAGVKPDLRVTKSNGGVMSASQAKTDCIQMVFSGTASGVIGASHVARLAGLRDCLSLDIGGTSADVALIVDGAPQFGTGEFIGEFQVFIPSVSVTSIGDGGGSIAWVDEHGVLKVGPESAGSSPGPACYGKGGTRPTLTDAFSVNGWIGHSALGYDAVRVDRDAARYAVGTLADKLGRTVHETAEAIIDVAVSGMYTGVSGVVSRHGIDLRGFALLPFGGAGPMMACFIARELEMPHIVVPATPGVLSALGGLMADLKNDFVHTVYLDLRADSMPELAASIRDLLARGERWLRAEQDYHGPVTLDVSAELRYKGQSFEIETPLQQEWFFQARIDKIAQAFHYRHRQVYGHADPSAPVQVVAIRVVASGIAVRPEFARIRPADGPPIPTGQTNVWFDRAWHQVPLYERSALLGGPGFAGPAIISQSDCTACVLPSFSTTIDDYGNLHICATR